MKLIALVSMEPGGLPPGTVIDIKDKAEAASLIARGLAAPAPAEPTAKAAAKAAAQQPAQAEPASAAAADQVQD